MLIHIGRFTCDNEEQAINAALPTLVAYGKFTVWIVLLFSNALLATKLAELSRFIIS